MATRILRSIPEGALQPLAWPQLGPSVQEFEQQMLAPSPPPHRSEPPGQHRPDSPEHACSPQDCRQREQWEARLQAEIEAARRESFQQGVEEGRRQASGQLQAEFARLARAIEEAAGLKSRIRAAAERELVELALAIARRVLRRELQVDADAVLGLAKAALEKASMREITEVRLHPALAAPVRAHLARIGAPETIEVREDPTLEPGALLLETSRGTIDASLDTQLDEIGRGLADALHPGGRP
jgi:flagellar assembly protein FliH